MSRSPPARTTSARARPALDELGRTVAEIDRLAG
jgi:hypothetical protein